MFYCFVSIILTIHLLRRVF